MASVGVRDVWTADLRRSPELRALAVREPGRFDHQVAHLESRLRQAMHFGAGYPAASGMVRGKLDELAQLKDDVARFRAQHMPEAVRDVRLPIGPAVSPPAKGTGTGTRPGAAAPVQAARPGHFGRKGAADKNIGAVLDHLATGGNAKSAVAHVMRFGGLSESTARRYVRAAVKEAARVADERIARLKERLSDAGRKGKLAAAAG